MKYVISGPALDNVLRENRIRIAKGELIVSPFREAEEAPADSKDAPVKDTKEVKAVDKKKPVNGKAKK